MAHLFLLLFFLSICSSRLHYATADATVTGYVFCDHCKDGKLSFGDLPAWGAKVAVSCAGSAGQMVRLKEATVNMLGVSEMSLSGTPDLSRCVAQVETGSGGGACEAVAVGPPRPLRLRGIKSGTESYVFDYLLSQPEKPFFLCFGAGGGSPVPTFPAPSLPLPPPPTLVPRVSACSYEFWIKSEHRCYWKNVGPNTTVGDVFGVFALMKYGARMTLWEALHGKGDLYMTLVREATTALLNYYNSSPPLYPLDLILQMQKALLGPPRQALRIALDFKKSSSGRGVGGGSTGACSFSPCS